MSTVTLPEDQLIELLVQLQKTTPDQARTILNSQPQITYALMSLMVKMNLVNVDILQNQLAAYAASNAPPVPQQPTQPAPSVPAHLMSTQPQPFQPSTYPPPAQTNPPPLAQTQQPHYQAQQGGYPAPNVPVNGQPSYGGRPGQYGQPPPPPLVQQGTPALPDALAGIPDGQRAMIMRVVTMTPDQIARLPPVERSSIMQLRATLGLPME